MSLLVLPSTCVLSALNVLYLHWRGGGALSYWWHVLPLVAVTLYLAYFNILVRQARHGR